MLVVGKIILRQEEILSVDIFYCLIQGLDLAYFGIGDHPSDIRVHFNGVA